MAPYVLFAFISQQNWLRSFVLWIIVGKLFCYNYEPVCSGNIKQTWKGSFVLWMDVMNNYMNGDFYKFLYALSKCYTGPLYGCSYEYTAF